MKRAEVIQTVIDRTGAQTYLEIGIDRGQTLLPLRVARKTGVDPAPQITWLQKLKYFLRDRQNGKLRIVTTTSDHFFATRKPGTTFDVVFIDGLHTHAQALRDALNAVQCLSPDGVIVLHDCNPPHAAAAVPADSYRHAEALKPPGWTGEWCGDVWKAVCDLRQQLHDRDVCVLDCDYGLGVITKRLPGNSPDPVPVEGLAEMSYQEFAEQRTDLLNLVAPDTLASIIDQHLKNCREGKRDALR